MVDDLTGVGPLTVFAPNNDAFAKIRETFDELMKPENIDFLKGTLLRHVVIGKNLVSGVIPKKETVLITAGGEQITVSKQAEVKIKSSVGTATVVKADTLASNGVIHIVDSVF